MSLATQEQAQPARWDLLLLDLEHRAEQVRQLKTIDLTNKGYEGKRLFIQALTAAAAVFAAGGVGGGVIVKILGG